MATTRKGKRADLDSHSALSHQFLFQCDVSLFIKPEGEINYFNVSQLQQRLLTFLEKFRSLQSTRYYADICVDVGTFSWSEAKCLCWKSAVWKNRRITKPSWGDFDTNKLIFASKILNLIRSFIMNLLVIYLVFN